MSAGKSFTSAAQHYTGAQRSVHPLPLALNAFDKLTPSPFKSKKTPEPPQRSGCLLHSLNLLHLASRHA